MSNYKRIYDDAERFATHDPDIDWPSDHHTDAVDAILAAFDRERERRQESPSSPPLGLGRFLEINPDWYHGESV